MKIDTDFLCNLWMVLYQFSDRDDVEDKDCNALIEAMDAIEKVLILKLQDESPNALRILAMITNFGTLRPPPIMKPLLKAYEPNLDNPIKKVA